jgi:hypothetical protein
MTQLNIKEDIKVLLSSITKVILQQHLSSTLEIIVSQIVHQEEVLTQQTEDIEEVIQEYIESIKNIRSIILTTVINHIINAGSMISTNNITSLIRDITTILEKMTINIELNQEMNFTIVNHYK